MIKQIALPTTGVEQQDEMPRQTSGGQLIITGMASHALGTLQFCASRQLYTKHFEHLATPLVTDIPQHITRPSVPKRRHSATCPSVCLSRAFDLIEIGDGET